MSFVTQTREYIMQLDNKISLLLKDAVKYYFEIGNIQTALNNLDNKTIPTPRTIEGNNKNNALFQECKKIFDNVVELLRHMRCIMNEQMLILNISSSINFLNIEAKKLNQYQLELDNKDNKNDSVVLSYSYDIIFNRFPIMKTIEIENLEIEQMINTIYSKSASLVDLNNKFCDNVNNCVISRNNIALKLRTAFNVDPINYTL